jgi:TonB-dependent starch-binding outer membrane protein SusC
MKNTGFDLILTYRSKPENDFRYSISANITHYKNEVVRLNNNPDELRYGDDLRGERYTITKQGYPVSSLYGYVVEGIFNTWEEVNAHPKYNPSITGVDSYSQPGVFKYKDVNGDGIISTNDRTIIGNPHPTFSYGTNFDFGYKNWDLTMFFQGVQGNDLVNYVSRWTDFQQFQGGRTSRRLYESWTTERYESGAKITMPMALANDSPMQKPSTFFVEDGSYLRMKNLQIGYTLPSQVTTKLGIKVFRIYLQADNLFTITKYTGLDPETRPGNDVNLGVDQGVYPTMQMILCGVNVSF